WECDSEDKFAAGFRSDLLQNDSYDNVLSDLTASASHSLLLGKWLRHCNIKHEECHRQAGKENFWPKRVICVDVDDLKELTLVEEQHQGEHYLVLSYCWGPVIDQDKKRFCTTSENYGSRKLGFSYDDLPKTFQDAIQVTRALQKQYLWIDALCIIQGPDGDWDSEAKTMADIFACAYCTSAASSARGWGDGFLKPQSEPPDIRVLRIPSTPTCACDFDDVDDGPHMKRAWVLQERVLSRRIIHFTTTHTYCECRDGVLCEQLIKLKLPWEKQYFILDPNFPKRLSDSGYERTADFREYSISYLTFETDWKVAIYSLVECMGQVLGTEVKYGIFGCFCGSLLLWKRTHKNKTPPIPYDKGQAVLLWFWMVYPGGIDFILDVTQGLLVLCSEDLGFVNDGQALSVKVRKFRGTCRMEQEEEEYAIFDGTEKVGSLWFDVADYIQFQDCFCVVVGMGKDDKKEDSRKTYNVLILR
ncbi:HET-domain-containing protein, partial [Parathielavia hyrcaniae]